MTEVKKDKEEIKEKVEEVKKDKKEPMTDEQLEVLLKKGWSSLQKAFDDLIRGCEVQDLDLVVDSLKLTKKIAEVYERAHMASFYASKGQRK
jgi:hypothetical protein